MSSQSSNAILAKARAMYGKSLKDNDYQSLLECRNVAEIAAYLKSRTNYSSVMSGLTETEIHRGQLEPILRQNIYFDVFALSRYALEDTLVFSDFVISKMEIGQIIRCLMMVNIGKPEEYLYTMPLSFDQFAGISLTALAGVRSYSDMLGVLKGTWYYPILFRFQPKEHERINITELESALYNHCYSKVLETISKGKNKGDRKELKDIFSAMLDFENMSRIMRLKKYYHFSPEQIRPLLGPCGKLSQKTLDEFCAADTAEKVLELSRSTYMGKLTEKLNYHDPTQMTDVMVYAYCKHHLRLSPNPTIVMISYVYLREIELKNIINLIEATRYGISADEKSKLLIK